MILPNFTIISDMEVSSAFKQSGIRTFYDAIQMIHHLPYGRISNADEFILVLSEKKGTCSSKHAILKALAEEHALYGLKLCLVIYAMNEDNTPGIGTILRKYDLPYMFEAHVYLAYDNEIYDYTFPGNQNLLWRDSIIIETKIDTDQIGNYKENFHKSVLKDWTQRDGLPYTQEDLWKIRQECIQALDQTTTSLKNDPSDKDPHVY